MWMDVDFETGRLILDKKGATRVRTSNEGGERALRKDHADLFKQQPRKIWAEFLGPMMEKEEDEIVAVLGKDLPTDGPFCILMTGIDKQATDDEIMEFFQESAPHCKV